MKESIKLNSFRVKSKLEDLMWENRHKMKDVVEKTGISRATLTRLYYNQSDAIHFSTIAALCELYNCGVGDLLVVEPRKEDAKTTGEND